jgi:hypothetical protein
MPDEMTCFACERQPTQQCPRCGRPYCDQHGEDVCDACLEPQSGLPSFTLYRGSLLALLIGTVLAVILILQPPGDKTNAAFSPVVVTPTQAVAQGSTGGLPTPLTVQTPGARTPAVNQTPTNPTGATGPTGTTGATGAAGGTYTVQAGDTLTAICDKVKPATMTNSACVDQIVSLNNLADAGSISSGQSLKVPQ